jgi:hypothetical protein
MSCPRIVLIGRRSNKDRDPAECRQIICLPTNRRPIWAAAAQECAAYSMGGIWHFVAGVPCGPRYFLGRKPRWYVCGVVDTINM